jgi:signal transduction histidine kinase
MKPADAAIGGLTAIGGLHDACAAADKVIAEVQDPRERAMRLAQTLRVLWPGARLCGCVLGDLAGGALAACDETGAEASRLDGALRQALARFAERAAPGEAETALLTRADKLAGKVLTAQRLHDGSRPRGWLALTLPSEADEPLSRLLLETFACHVERVLACETDKRALQALAHELETETRRADVAELMGPALHEFSNFLNTAMLTAAVLEMKATPEQKADLSAIRRQGADIAALLGRFQQVRHAAPRQRNDLNALIRQVLANLQRRGDDDQIPALHVVVGDDAPGAVGPGQVTTRLELNDAPAVLGFCADVRRLCGFVIKNAARAAAAAQGTVLVWTGKAGGGARLRVEDGGPSVSEEDLKHLFHPERPGRPGTSGLELAACQALGKRLGAALEVEQAPGGGLALSIQFPPPP